MSLFNTYGNTQIKVGDLRMAEFQIGDPAEIPDGVYVGLDGVIVVIGGIFVAEFPKLTDKWGDPIDLNPLIARRLYTTYDPVSGEPRVIDPPPDWPVGRPWPPG
jgi:hypothetical protein